MSSSKHLATLEEHLNTGAPNPNPPDTQQRILDEDAYVDTLQHIITRDFYPDLYKLNKQNQNIDLFGTPGPNVTPTPIKQYKQYKQNKQNNNSNNNKSNSPKTNTFENAITPTPNQLHNSTNHSKQENDSDNENENENEETDDLLHYVNGEILSNEEKEKMKHLNLKQFQNTYTSEDNYSFNEIQYKNELQHFSKYPWIYQQQKLDDNRKKYLSISHAQNTNNSNDNNSEKPKAIQLATDSNINTKNSNKTISQIMQENDEKKYNDEKELDKKVDLYKDELEFWKFKAVNKLMFFPEAERERNIAIMKQLQNEFGKPECIYNNTRFPDGFKMAIANINPNSKPIKLSEMEKHLKGYSMVYTPNIEHGDAEIILDNKPVFHIAKVPKKDKIVYALNKKKTEKLRRQQQSKLRSNPRMKSVYTPYNTQQILTPSGNRIETPLVGLQMGANWNKNQHRNSKKYAKYNRQNSLRSIEMLSPAARKLMEKNMKMTNKLSMSATHTPLSSVLRSAYSTPTPKVSRHKKRKRKDETPALVIDSTPKVNQNDKKRRKLNDSVFKKPKHSIKEKNNHRKQQNTCNITDGLL